MEKRVLNWENPDLPGIVGVKVVLKGQNPQEYPMLGAMIRSIAFGSFRAEMRSKTVRIRKRRRQKGKKQRTFRKLVTKVSFRYLRQGRWASLALRRPPKGSDDRMEFDALVDLLHTTRTPMVHTIPQTYTPSTREALGLTLIFTPPLPRHAEDSGQEGLPRT